MTFKTTTLPNDYTAELEGNRVTITQDGAWAGEGVWTGQRIEGCSAVLGSGDADESDHVYDVLDGLIAGFFNQNSVERSSWRSACRNR